MMLALNFGGRGGGLNPPPPPPPLLRPCRESYSCHKLQHYNYTQRSLAHTSYIKKPPEGKHPMFLGDSCSQKLACFRSTTGSMPPPPPPRPSRTIPVSALEISLHVPQLGCPNYAKCKCIHLACRLAYFIRDRCIIGIRYANYNRYTDHVLK